MAHQSFEDPEVAALLGDHFIAIKVDREERPDIDAVYMSVCQAMTGSGGWPLTAIMTPDKQPFFAGTYFPKRGQYGQLGLMEILERVADQWRQDSSVLIRSGAHITREMVRLQDGRPPAGGELGTAPLKKGLDDLARSYDPRYGGFGAAPKFPTPHTLLFLLQSHALGMGGKALEMAEGTLRSLYRGGIFDHAGGGFSRYATDTRWLIPHFEKMLYDNALLTLAYCEAYQLTGTPLYRYVAEETLAYIAREMTHPEGGFYSAQDADSDGEEGKHYTWSRAEILDLLGEPDGAALCADYGVVPEGNFEGKNILNRLHSKKLEPPGPESRQLLGRLRAARSGRYPLHTDDKILTAWNAMMIAAHARAARVLGQPDYLAAALRALAFLDARLTAPGGRLMASWREGRAAGPALLDDYAYLAWACLELYETTGLPDYLGRALAMAGEAQRLFADPQGGFFMSPADGEALIYRPKELYDGAMPSGNSVMAWCLARISALTGQADLETLCRRQLGLYADWFKNQPTACSFALKALALAVCPTWELVCAAPSEAAAEPLRRALAGRYLPQLTLHILTPENRSALIALAPFLAEYGPKQPGAPTYYLCRGRACSAPTQELQAVLDALDGPGRQA